MIMTLERTRDIGLDHVRALAAFTVFGWHFMHFANGYPVPFEGAPLIFPLAFFDEGHTGVSLFMALSGYIFAKILDGKIVNYPAFMLRRAIRLLPLLFAMLIVEALRQFIIGADLNAYFHSLIAGVVQPTLPNGAWSLTVEFHFYVLLPLLLYLLRKSPAFLLIVVLLAILVRLALFMKNGTVFWPAYWTIFGRIDQFVFGILGYHFRAIIVTKHRHAVALGLIFLLFFYFFDLSGGLYQMPSWPSTSSLWIVMPSIEGAVYGLLIAYYDGSFKHSQGHISRFVGNIGKYSYSIYLWHFLVVFHMANFVHTRIVNISHYYTGQLWAFICFLTLLPFAYVSYKIFEEPFMKRGLSYSSR